MWTNSTGAQMMGTTVRPQNTEAHNVGQKVRGAKFLGSKYVAKSGYSHFY